jgi:hypothetical protein
MGNLDELRAQINEAEMALATLQAQLKTAEKQQHRDEPKADAPADGQGQDQSPPEDGGFLQGVEDSDLGPKMKQELLKAAADADDEEVATEDAELDTKDNAHLAYLKIGQKEESADPHKAKAPVKTEPEPELDLETLWETVYADGDAYNPKSDLDKEKMGEMRLAIESDPRIKKLATTDPERFALYMYGRKSMLQ